MNEEITEVPDFRPHPVTPIQGSANQHFPAAHIINPTTLLALHRLAYHTKRRKRKGKGSKKTIDKT